ncbi:glycogen operon protein [Pseudoalteromonas ulvae UL12]|uniref:Glycogen debranching enzyme GlgX n=1 Tax=Pseudoalteromonas ulvae TaxID=107327 RepID=A0A244CRF2_PSEDV|nr:glycogen debranching protein GlgX [Pseudoalteromonas ulvae]MBE0366109.1 glycogen operon protein [Pseudoalteromonas ulvae UL12]OUL58172.1 glycogen debranching enzyme GlgX [Pseudoalteromonas ulvae]
MSNVFEFTAGKPYPLGSTLSPQGVNFAVFSAHATRVELCLFDASGHSEIARLPLIKGEQHIWHGLVLGAKAGLLYGYRVHGPYMPELGHRFNPQKLLIDPYARSLQGEFNWSNLHCVELPESLVDSSSVRELDSASDTPKSKVIGLTPYDGIKPAISWQETVIYECHVRGATLQHPLISSVNRGKFLGLAEPVFIEHLKSLGVTTIELLPCHEFISERFLVDKGLSNYWGYNTLNFFTPHREYLVDNDVSEFQSMVKILHQHDIEVIIDVVYNHTAEGNSFGPTLCYRGLDNSNYYRLDTQNPRNYINDTGCGNTININHPRVLQLILDSLRYWVQIMGVDGFRFDLAPILGRQYSGFKTRHAFFQAINQDPILSQVKLIAEPWDIGPGGYQLGGFPIAWREWNDKYRDTMRRFWRGDSGLLPEFAQRLHGSNDLFEHNGRGPSASINFITAHDGFTLADLVTYENKHNLDNGEDNKDGHSENYSANYGQEGPCHDIDITAMRLQQQKNLLLTLLLSQGIPMVCAGSEMAHSQHGNNNAYCQDNKLNWLTFDNHHYAHPLHAFIKQLVAIRSRFLVYKKQDFLHHNDPDFALTWLSAHGEAMKAGDWTNESNQQLGYLIEPRASIKQQDALLILFNAANDTHFFHLPARDSIQSWQLLCTTTAVKELRADFTSSDTIAVAAKSCWVLSAVIQEHVDGTI